MLWLKSINLYAALGLVLVGGLIVTGIFNAGANYNEGKHERATAQTNTLIVEQRGKDEVEMAAEKLAAEMRDKVFASSPRQKLILDEATAKLLGGR